MRIIVGKTYKETRVVLDNTHFAGCEITDCLLIYSGQQFKITDSSLNNVQLQFSGAAENTIGLLAQLKINPKDLLGGGAEQKQFDLMMSAPLKQEQ